MDAMSMNRYWIPQWNIHKKIVFQELHYYLGPQATARSYTLDGEDGYLISTPGPCLSDEQLDDLCRKSEDYWSSQEATRSQREPEKKLKRPMHQPVALSRGGGHSPRRK